ncbi:amidophosphoribosyltransferase [Candidatus Haliotispira prima]|uniref:Amidophosphoribosyltransferase n=1 Tax=Candidatus Haliotispira prima TaxID=3034016 RepID=A0ABY8MI52_9SPIO|nr:amidophosphoribosyltransferase [Candidatus Haliotispira prima]
MNIMCSMPSPSAVRADAPKPADCGPGEKCGIVGIHHPGNENVAPLLYYSLFSLQHRGQESAGISVYDSAGGRIQRYKSPGLLSENFSKEDLNRLFGHVGVAHVRYATTGESSPENIQPIEHDSIHGNIALAHNGNLTNTKELRKRLQKKGLGFVSSSDTEVFLKLFTYHARKDERNVDELLSSLDTEAQTGYPLLEYALLKAQEETEGAYSIVIGLEDKLLAVRDCFGIRPLVIGRRENPDGTALHVLASETCALDAIGVPYLRDVEAGESVIIDNDGLHSLGLKARKSRSMCAFEYIYFARSDSYLEEISVHDARYRAGELLYQQEAGQETSCGLPEVVVGVPDSGLAAAIGYAEASKLPLRAGIVKNRYVARSFIQPDNAERQAIVKVKFNVVKHLVAGKSVLVIDDSLVRGNTSQLLVQELRNAGAREVHFRLASPMVSYPCFYGIDFPTREELLAYGRDLEGLRQKINVESLAFLTLENLALSTGRGKNLCTGCFTGLYAGGFYDDVQQCYQPFASDPEPDYTPGGSGELFS